MSWHFSQALAEACWRQSSSDGTQSVQSNSTGTDGTFFSLGKRTVRYILSRSGMTSAPSTGFSGEDVLTWCLEASPAQAYSSAARGKNTADDLWPEMRRVVAETAPRYVFAENVQRRAIDRAADDLEAMGYQTRCIALSAADVGADHERKRYWIRAYADGDGELRGPVDAKMAVVSVLCRGVWGDKPGSSRVPDGMAGWVDRLAASGAGQVPAVAAAAWRILEVAA